MLTDLDLDDMCFNVDVDFCDPCQLSVYCRDKDKGKGKGKNKDKDLHDPCPLSVYCRDVKLTTQEKN